MSCSSRRPVVVALALLSVALSACRISPSNPFDPESTNPAKGTLNGQVRAVFARDDNGEPVTAGACDSSEVGDHSGFRVVLRGVRDGGEGIAALSADTNESGLFSFVGVPPGPYSLEVLRVGFAVPPAAEVNVGIGEVRNIGALCAINTSGPPPPVLAALPDAVRPTDGPLAIVVSDADPACVKETGCAVSWEIRQQREGEAARIDVVTAAAASVELVLAGADTTPRRVSISITVTAIDALGNRSQSTNKIVVVDDKAPPPPTTLPPSLSRDRVTVSFTPAATVDGDDGAASFFVAYGVVDREDDDENAALRDDCPFGRPRRDASGAIVDNNGRPTFALEGQSPIATTTTTQTLSGIAPGTDLLISVAAVDAVGNAGCYGAPVVARPDVVVFVPGPVRAASETLAGTQRAARLDGITDGAVAFARGSAGLAVIDTTNALTTLATPVTDVVADGRRFITAAGAVGVQVVPVDDNGAPVRANIDTIDVGGTVTSLALRPGTALAGTTTGLAVIDLDAGTASAIVDVGGRGAVTRVASFGQVVVLARPTGISVADRAAPHTERAFVATRGVIDDLLVHGDAAVVSLGGQGVAAFDLRGCLTGGGSCLAPLARRALPRNGSAHALAAFDEFVAVATDEDDASALLLLDPQNSFAIVGRANLVEAAAAVAVEPGLLCAVGGSNAAACQSPFTGPLVDVERRLATVGDVKRVRLDGASVVAFEEGGRAGVVGDVVRADLATLAVTSRSAIVARGGDPRVVDPVGGVVLDDGRVVVVDATARVFVVDPAGVDGAVLVADLGARIAAEVPAVADPALASSSTLSGFVERVGSDLFFVAVDDDSHAVAVRAPLRDNNTGLAIDPDDVDVAALADVEQVTNLIARNGRLFIPTLPFGLFVVDSADFSADVSALAPADSGSCDDLAFVLDDAGVAEGRLLGTRGDGIDGIFTIDAAQSFAVGADVAIGNAMTAIASLLVVSANQAGVITILVDDGDGTLVPVLELPSASQAEEARGSAHSVVVADSAGGVLRVTLR